MLVTWTQSGRSLRPSAGVKVRDRTGDRPVTQELCGVCRLRAIPRRSLAVCDQRARDRRDATSGKWHAQRDRRLPRRARRAASGACLGSRWPSAGPGRGLAVGSIVWVTARADNRLLAYAANRLLNSPAAARIADVRVGTAPVGVAVFDHGDRVIVADSNRLRCTRSPRGAHDRRRPRRARGQARHARHRSSRRVPTRDRDRSAQPDRARHRISAPSNSKPFNSTASDESLRPPRGPGALQASSGRAASAPRATPLIPWRLERPRSLQTLWRSWPRVVEGVGTPRAGCGVSLRAEDCGLGAGPTIHERSTDA